ncbi:hypothetical protein BKA81DRAFT_349039 [Phyllosticta paracitricarpa]
MEKIKNIFNPGHKQDQEILYGSPSAQRPDSPTAGTAQPQDSLYVQSSLSQSRASELVDQASVDAFGSLRIATRQIKKSTNKKDLGYAGRE